MTPPELPRDPAASDRAGSPGKLLARGRTAEIYAWRSGQVLKLFRPGRSAAVVEYEALVNRRVHAAGLPTPAVGDVIEVGGRFGLVYERVDGITMVRDVIARPWRVRALAAVLARLQHALHAQAAPELSPLRERLERSIRAGAMPEALRARALEVLARLPDGDRLCHGDFHPANVVLTKAGPIVIDWLDATQGHPAADVARSSILMRLGLLPESVPVRLVVRALRRSFHDAYLREYFRRAPSVGAQVPGWLPVVAAARIREQTGDEARLLRLAQGTLGRGRTD